MKGKRLMLYVLICTSGVVIGTLTKELSWPARIVLLFCIISMAIAFRLLTGPEIEQDEQSSENDKGEEEHS